MYYLTEQVCGGPWEQFEMNNALFSCWLESPLKEYQKGSKGLEEKYGASCAACSNASGSQVPKPWHGTASWKALPLVFGQQPSQDKA